ALLARSAAPRKSFACSTPSKKTGFDWQSPGRFDRVASTEGAMISVTVNGRKYDVDVSPDTPLLWVIRDTIGLTGTKFGCGLQQCGACTVHLDGEPIRSCATQVSRAADKKVTTIEGLSPTSNPP